MTRILVYEPLSAGAPDTRGNPAHADLLAAGRAMRDAIAGDLARLDGVTTTVALGEQEAGHPDGRLRLLAQPAGESAVEFVARAAPLQDLCWIVAPETDGLLARLHDAVGAARWVGCTAAAIHIASSKRATCAALARAGLRTPLAFEDREGGAWIVKPDDGAGSVATRVHATRAAAQADLQERQRTGRNAIAEPFIPGEALSIAVIVGPVLARAVAFNRQRLQVDANGWLHDLGVQPAAIGSRDPRAPALRALPQRVAAAMPGLRGYVGIDVVWNEEVGPVVIEVNPRVTCAYVGLSALLRRNLAADILAAHAGPNRTKETVHAAA